MGLFKRGPRKEERRVLYVPWANGGLGGDISTDQALRLVPYFACVRLIADSVASLPLKPYRDVGGIREPASDPKLIASPSAVLNPFEWVHQLVVSMATWGNAYGLIAERDGFGFPIQIEWMPPAEISPDDTKPTMPVYRWRGQTIPTADVFHVPWFTPPGSRVGLSPVSAFAGSIGVGLSATNYGKAWFDNGGQPPGVFVNKEQTVPQKEAEAMKAKLLSALKKREPLVHGNDWQYTALSVNPEESQFIETMKMSATQIAAIFGVPPERVGGEAGSSLTYSTVEQNELNFQMSVLRPWLVRIETALSAVLPERVYVKFNMDAGVRADLKTRYEAHHIALTDGWKSRDEVRELEDLPPLPNGQGKAIGPPPGVDRNAAA